MNRGSRRLTLWFAVLVAALWVPPLHAQATGFIQGYVRDERNGQPLSGVQVFVEARRIGTVTNQAGLFRLINVPVGENVLTASMIGYGSVTQTVSVAAGQVTALNLTMSIHPVDMDAIVVTGQGGATQRRRVATKIDVISSQTIEAAPVSRLDQLLQTQLPAAQIRVLSGQAGTTSLFRTRGILSASTNSTPVIYVDGVRVDNLNTQATLGLSISGSKSQGAATSAIADLPLENIERIEYVPGGAATTLYGSDAANGVIQIFTRKGTAGPLRMWAQSEVGYDTPITQFQFFKRTRDLLYRNGLAQKYDLGFEGGSGGFTYSVGGDVRANQSHRVYGDNHSLGFRSSMGAEMGSTGRYSASMSYSENEMPRFRNGNSGGYNSLWFVEGGRSNAYGFNPNLDDLTDTEFAAIKKFVDTAERLENYRVFVRRFQTSHGVVLEPTPSLTLRGTFGMDYRFSNERGITTNEFLIATKAYPVGTSDRGTIDNYDRKFMGFTVDISGQHRKNFDKVSVVSSAGMQLFRNDDEQVQYSAQNVRDGAETLTGAGVTLADDYTSRVVNWGIFGQTNVSVLDRYTAEVGLRADRNTAFGTAVGTQLYPKLGLIYAASSEPWLRDRISERVLSDLRLRAAYGVAGNFPRPFANDRTVSFSPYLGKQSATFGQPGNPDLGPERTSTWEVGTDAGFLNDRVRVGFTWYRAITNDALFDQPAAPSTGLASQLRNVGKIQNKGIELSATVVPISTSSLRLSVTGSLNTLNNIVLSSGGSPVFALGGLSSRTIQAVVEEGFPVGYLRGPKAIFAPDGSITEVKQLSYLGKPSPDQFGNFSASLEVGNSLTFSLNGDYQFGAQAHSFDRHFRFLYGLKGTENDVPAAALAQYGNDRNKIWLDVFNCFVENTDYVKLRGLSADYRLAEQFLPRGVKNARIGFSVTNVLGWASSSFDPESDLSGAMSQGAAAVGGFNYSTDSQARSFMLTLRLGF